MSVPGPIGMIGTGVMGAPIVGRLTAAGHAVRAFDADAQALQRAMERGAVASTDPAAVAAACGLVFVCVSNHRITEQLLTGPDGVFAHARPGTVVVDLGTAEARLCRALAEQAAQRELHFLDAPLSGSVPGAEQGTLTIMVGGDADAFARLRPVFETFGRGIFHLGGPGAGQVVKLCHQLTFMATLTGLSEAIALAARMGVEGTDLLDVLETCVAPNRVMEFMRPMLAGGEGFRIPGGGTALLRKDLAAVKALGADAGMAVPVANPLEALFADAMAAGGGDADLFGLWQLFDQQVLGN